MTNEVKGEKEEDEGVIEVLRIYEENIRQNKTKKKKKKLKV